MHVTLDRRSGIDRRQSPADLEDLLILFSQLPSTAPAKKQSLENGWSVVHEDAAPQVVPTQGHTQTASSHIELNGLMTYRPL